MLRASSRRTRIVRPDETTVRRGPHGIRGGRPDRRNELRCRPLQQSRASTVLGRGTADKQLPGGAPAVKPALAKAGKAAAGPALEDWWLVRDAQGRVGWVLSRMVDVDVPLDIAQYAEGQRFVAFFVLDEVQDAEKKVPQYLCVLTDPHDGLPFDFGTGLLPAPPGQGVFLAKLPKN